MNYFGDIQKEVKRLESSGLIEIYSLQGTLLCQIQLSKGGGKGDVINEGFPHTVFIAGCNSAVEASYSDLFGIWSPRSIHANSTFNIQFEL